MRRLYFFILALIINVGALKAAEAIDTLSYAYGHFFTLFAMEDESNLMKDEDNYADYIRGLDENFGLLVQNNDSSYLVSYAMGVMEGTFISNSLEHTKQENKPPVSCIIAGLRKVGNGEIELPADTIAAMSFIKQYSGKGLQPSDLDEEIRCPFYTAFGIMKAYQPGLQQYIDETMPGTKFLENRQAYATGMADMIESQSCPPNTAYNLGKSIMRYLKLFIMQDTILDRLSFLSGAKAALGLSEQLIPIEDVERILSQRAPEGIITLEKNDQ
ncbi:MAG: hypothetical protein K2H60_13890 [Muribaculaceae bacterium]|nr:hypothetical protein [Muribaculaceae bacterium]